MTGFSLKSSQLHEILKYIVLNYTKYNEVNLVYYKVLLLPRLNLDRIFSVSLSQQLSITQNLLTS